MDAYFFDASALIKRYVNEAGSTWVQSLLAPSGGRIYVARIGGVEVIAALTRLAKGGYISAADAAINIAAFRHDLAVQYVAIPVNHQIVSSAMDLAENTLSADTTPSNLPPRWRPMQEGWPKAGRR